MFKDIKDFYPTPELLIRKMVDKIKTNELQYILEPSAGSGSIIEYYKKYYKTHNYRYMRNDESVDTYITFDAIEIDNKLISILRGKDINVVHNDFMSFEASRFYDLIIANFPFSQGCEHLLKSIKIQERMGGKIVCILNSETLLNPYSNNRKELVQKLKEYNADIEYIKDVFLDAERKTGVEIALIYIDVPMQDDATMFEKAFKRENEDLEFQSFQALVPNMSNLDKLIFECELVKKSVIELFREKHKIDHLLEGLNLKSKISICNDSCNAKTISINSFINSTNLEYWQKFIDNADFKNRLPSKLRENFTYNMEKQKNISFNKENVKYFYEQLIKSIPKSYEDTCSKIFDELTVKSAYNTSAWNKNIWLYNGWKTNDCFKIKGRSIVRFYNSGFMYRLPETITDLIIVFENLSGKKNTLNYKPYGSNQTEYDRILKSIKNYEKDIDSEFFLIDAYKKGTLHLKYKDEKLIEQFNIIVGKSKMWLPSDFGEKSYQDMGEKEKLIIRNFGIEINDYNQLLRQQDYLRLIS